MKANKPEKRKDIMTNIKRRLELGTYSVSDVIRNQRDVLTNTINMVKDIGNELLRTERSAK